MIQERGEVDSGFRHFIQVLLKINSTKNFTYFSFGLKKQKIFCLII